MKIKRNRLLHEVAQMNGLVAATEKAGIELTQFIDFVQQQNPNVDRTAATWTAAFCLHNLPTLFADHPEMMDQMRAIANKMSEY